MFSETGIGQVCGLWYLSILLTSMLSEALADFTSTMQVTERDPQEICTQRESESD